MPSSHAPGWLLHTEITRRAVGAFFETYRELGFGFSEALCAEALAIVLSQRRISFVREPSVPVNFRGQQIGSLRPDFVVEDTVLLELKAVRVIEPRHDAQVLNYLRATEMEIGLLLNFGPEATFKRFVFANARKRNSTSIRGMVRPSNAT